MAIKKARRLLAIEFLDNDLKELRLANYLKSTNNAKGKLLITAQAHLYSIALSEDPSSSDEDIEIAMLESLRLLWGQMNYIVDYHRIKRKIQITPQSLMRFGLETVARENVVTSQLQSLLPMMLPGGGSNTSDDDDDDDTLKDFCGDSDSLNLDL
jgi:hypothetical protein